MEKERFFTALAVLMVFSSAGFAWDWDTHRFLASKTCEFLSCGACEDAMRNGSVAPDRDFKDFYYHTAARAPAKSAEWLDKARVVANDAGCEAFYDVGVASHYFFDAKDYWHSVSGEDYEGCHAPFETKVGEKIGKNFSVTQCNATVTSAEFDAWLAEFYSEVAGFKNSEVSGRAGSAGNSGQDKENTAWFLGDARVAGAAAAGLLLWLLVAAVRRRKRK